MCNLNSICWLSPEECQRSTARIVKGQFYPGEDHGNYQLTKSDAPGSSSNVSLKKSFERLTLSDEPVPRENTSLPKPRYELLSDKVSKQLGRKRCIVCNNFAGQQITLKTHGNAMTMNRLAEPPKYVAKACGHCFHEACLYSFLTEPHHLHFVKCTKCEFLQDLVRLQRWDALEVEVAMDLITDN